MAKTAKTARSARKPAYASKTDNGWLLKCGWSNPACNAWQNRQSLIITRLTARRDSLKLARATDPELSGALSPPEASRRPRGGDARLWSRIKQAGIARRA